MLCICLYRINELLLFGFAVSALRGSRRCYNDRMTVKVKNIDPRMSHFQTNSMLRSQIKSGLVRQEAELGPKTMKTQPDKAQTHPPQQNHRVFHRPFLVAF